MSKIESNNLEIVYLELELYFNKILYDEKIIDQKEYIKVEKNILKQLNKRQK